MATHIVVWGEWLAKIAYDYGTTVAAIWNAPENAAHRARRGSPDVLYPGDELFIPGDAVDPPKPPAAGLHVPYVVRQGDFLEKLALQFRFDAEEVWTNPLNGLVAARRDPNLLYPGDILFIPERPADPSPLVSQTTNVFTADLPVVPVELRFVRGNEPRADEGVSFNGLPPHVEPPTETDELGCVRVEVPALLPVFEVYFVDEPHIVYTVLVGHLDPIEEATGVVQRLIGLGYFPFDEEDPTTYPEELHDDPSTLLMSLLTAYQVLHGLNGELGATMERLRKEFGA